MAAQLVGDGRLVIDVRITDEKIKGKVIADVINAFLLNDIRRGLVIAASDTWKPKIQTMMQNIMRERSSGRTPLHAPAKPAPSETSPTPKSEPRRTVTAIPTGQKSAAVPRQEEEKKIEV